MEKSNNMSKTFSDLCLCVSFSGGYEKQLGFYK